MSWTNVTLESVKPIAAIVHSSDRPHGRRPCALHIVET